MQLKGYDSRPVVTADRYRFTPVAGRPGAFRLASVSDSAWEDRHGLQEQPWDAGPIVVRTAPGVLGIFDTGSLSQADGVLASVSQGIPLVAAQVPYAWSQRVVVYALSDDDFLSSLDDLPGDDPTSLDAVAFPVRVGPGSTRYAATRIVLNASILDRAGPERDQLLRHELTHVAIGPADDHAPVWIGEGVADYVAAASVPPEVLRLPADAISAARTVTGLPADSTFNDGDAVAHYTLSWWVCEYVARNYGEPTLWSLLEHLQTAGDASADQPDGSVKEQDEAIVTRARHQR